jgi:hypothetical protein
MAFNNGMWCDFRSDSHRPVESDDYISKTMSIPHSDEDLDGKRQEMLDNIRSPFRNDDFTAYVIQVLRISLLTTTKFEKLSVEGYPKRGAMKKHGKRPTRERSQKGAHEQDTGTAQGLRKTELHVSSAPEGTAPALVKSASRQTTLDPQRGMAGGNHIEEQGSGNATAANGLLPQMSKREQRC